MVRGHGHKSAGAAMLAEVMVDVETVMVRTIACERAAVGVFESVKEPVKVKRIGGSLLGKNRVLVMVDTDLESDC